MIKHMHIEQYRKLKNIDFEFSENINAISGTNGTCKTSLLHLFSNSFQAVNKSCAWINDPKCIQTINAVNAVTNPKVESLTRGDKKYNDPAHGVSGILFTVDFFDGKTLGFRRHNSAASSRYAVKPKYQVGAHETLPACPVIYLGLSRLLPFGEYQNDDAVSDIKKSLPDKYQQEIATIYKRFTHYEVTPSSTQKMGDIKTRADFSSNYEGIDSNTISAGEDNLYIILTALVSLKYYFDSITSSRAVESILLIDELDATLHPALQINLLNLFRDFTSKYKIQIVFTTHSMSLLETMLSCRDNVLYLVDNITNVVKMDDIDIYKIKMHLSSMTHEDIYRDKVIPIFSEDAEARFLLDMILSRFEEAHPDEFRGVRRFFHVVNVNLGADSLANIFGDSKLLRMTMRSICVLDGDHNSNLTDCIVALPGKNGNEAGSRLSPEELLFQYAKLLYEKDDEFWTDRTILNKGYGKAFYLDRIQNAIDDYNREAEEGATTEKRREFNKRLFNEHKSFFSLLFKHWLHNPENSSELHRFYRELKTLFKKVALYNEISELEWV